MYKTIVVVAAVAGQAAHALSTTKLDTSTLYGGIKLAQTGTTTESKVGAKLEFAAPLK